MISATFLLKHVSSGQREGTKPTAHVVGHLALISQEDLPNSDALEELKIEQHQCESVITWQGEYCSWSTWDLGVALLAALWDGKAQSILGHPKRQSIQVGTQGHREHDCVHVLHPWPTSMRLL